MSARDQFIALVVVAFLCGATFVAEKGDLSHVETPQPSYAIVRQPGQRVSNVSARLVSWNSSSKSASGEAHIAGPPPLLPIEVNVEETANNMADELSILLRAWRA